MHKDVREISKLYCDPAERGKGDATMLLKAICKEADAKKMVLVLVVDPYGDNPPLSKEDLSNWYGSTFDFNTIQANPHIMARMFNPFPESDLAKKVVGQILTEV